jgi:hypothetical protein
MPAAGRFDPGATAWILSSGVEMIHGRMHEAQAVATVVVC